MNWSPQQGRALDDVGRWLRAGPQVFKLFGYAGTGKTTLAQHLASLQDGLVLFGAYTGKAASVLRAKGCVGAQTIHSMLYNVGERDREKLRDLRHQLQLLLAQGGAHPDDIRSLELDIAAQERLLKEPYFTLREDSIVRDSALVVLDECSMVDARLGRDLLSFGKKILVLGDPGQLPPIKGGGFFTNQDPDILLTEIHRQAADNPILQYATMARKGENIPFGDLGLAKKIHKASITNAFLAASGDMLLTGKNETRRNLNKAVRRHRGFTGILPNEGEQLVCLKNDKRYGLLNGMLMTTTSLAVVDPTIPDSCTLNAVTESGDPVEFLECDIENFKATFDNREPEPKPWSWSATYPTDFGYALTVHKAQGSQWDGVTLCDDGFAKTRPRERAKWLYTAITRAAKRLTIVA